MADYTLVIDIGNTSTSLGLYRKGKVTRRKRIPGTEETASRLRALLADMRGPRIRIAGVSIASVVPWRNEAWKQSLEEETGAPQVWCRHRLDLGIPITYPKPDRIGADRLANAAGAADRYGTPVIVADFGTALTFDCVTRKGGYEGGIIAPGLPLMFSYLAEKTALLPHIEKGEVSHSIGKSTPEAMRLGTQWGYLGMVKEILANLRKSMGGKRVKVCATGGDARWILKGLKEELTFDHDLTLYGLGIIYERNPPE